MKSGGRFLVILILVIVAAVLAVKLLGGGVAPVPSAFASGLTLEQAIERSTGSGKAVLVLATADWCGPCQRFKRGPLSEAAVAEYIGENFEPVYLDVDQQGALASKLEVESVPALRVLQPGRSPARLDGYAETDRLIDWLKSAREAGPAVTPAG